MAWSSDKRHGFTLIELLVVLAVVAVLLSLVLPALAASLREARSTVCQSRLSQIMQAHAVASGENGGYWANCFRREDESVVITTNENAWAITYFDQSRAWVATLIDVVWSSGEGGQSVTCPTVYAAAPSYGDVENLYDAIPLRGGFDSYYYSAALISDAALWDPGDPAARESPLDFRRRVGSHEVLYPSSKVAMSEIAAHHDNRRAVYDPGAGSVNAGFADGHVATREPTKSSAALVWKQPAFGFPPDMPIPFSAAALGFQGLDY